MTVIVICSDVTLVKWHLSSDEHLPWASTLCNEEIMLSDQHSIIWRIKWSLKVLYTTTNIYEVHEKCHKKKVGYKVKIHVDQKQTVRFYYVVDLL